MDREAAEVDGVSKHNLRWSVISNTILITHPDGKGYVHHLIVVGEFEMRYLCNAIILF